MSEKDANADALDALNTYIQRQQQKINEQMQHIMMLETKVRLLEAENNQLKSINSELNPKPKTTQRIGLSQTVKEGVSARKADPIVQKITIEKFDLQKQRGNI